MILKCLVPTRLATIELHFLVCLLLFACLFPFSLLLSLPHCSLLASSLTLFLPSLPDQCLFAGIQHVWIVEHALVKQRDLLPSVPPVTAQFSPIIATQFIPALARTAAAQSKVSVNSTLSIDWCLYCCSQSRAGAASSSFFPTYVTLSRCL